MEYDPFSCFMVDVTASNTSCCSFARGCSYGQRARGHDPGRPQARSCAATHLVCPVDLVRKDVQQNLRVGVRAEVTLVRQLALALQSCAQLLRIGQVTIVNLRWQAHGKRTG